MRDTAPPPAAHEEGLILRLEHAERHLADGERTTRICLRHIHLASGQVYGLSGPSGIGKTTALEMLSLARIPDVIGAMSVCDRMRTIDLAPLMRRGKVERLARLRAELFGYAVQTSRLFPFLTVQDNIRLAQDIAGRRDDSFVAHLMADLRIAPLAGTYPAALSGGQRQRVSIARALAHRPTVVLADEPTAAVDQEMAEAILRLLRAYARAWQAAVVIITHNVDLARRHHLLELEIRSSTTGRDLHTVISGHPPAPPPGPTHVRGLA